MKYFKDDMSLFWNYIKERHIVFKKKELEQSPPPWTEDPILQQFKFTNVFRTLDPGTRFVTDYIYRCDKVVEKHICDWPVEETLFNVIVYRLFNKIETFMHHGMLDCSCFNMEKFEDSIRDRAVDDKVFTSAFVVSGYSCFPKGLDKISRLALLIKELADRIEEDYHSDYLDFMWETESMEDAYNYLLSIKGLGPFLAYQCAVELSYWDATNFGEDDFVVAGPGCKNGLRWLFPEKQAKWEELCFWLRDHQYEFWEDYGIDYKKVFDDRPKPYLTVMAIENCLCEISKYLKAYYNTGRRRNKYEPTAGHKRFQQKDYLPWTRTSSE